MKLMADILETHYLWKLKKPLCGFMDAGKHFWLHVKEILEDNEWAASCLRTDWTLS